MPCFTRMEVYQYQMPTEAMMKELAGSLLLMLRRPDNLMQFQPIFSSVSTPPFDASRGTTCPRSPTCKHLAAIGYTGLPDPVSPSPQQLNIPKRIESLEIFGGTDTSESPLSSSTTLTDSMSDSEDPLRSGRTAMPSLVRSREDPSVSAR